MSVSVTGLTKTFGAQRAVDDLSFKVDKGILGFLGPNGAGKSTTMRILTGFLVPDHGEVLINGMDLTREPLNVKRTIGYLPEHNPLYPDLYIREYLKLICAIHKVPDHKRRIDEVIGMTGLQGELGKQIGALSKGYRQRVGLAQALLHDPDVLILDEPTSGLDPNQLAEIRQLIRSLGKRKTVIFSTHIMQEVQAICDRVLIIHRGKLVLDKPIDYLAQRGAGGQRVRVQFDRRVLSNTLKAIKGVVQVHETDPAVYELVTDDDIDIRADVFSFAVAKSVTIIEMYRIQSSVEDIFQMLTTRE
ncbi:MAG: ATP-binding cassette domain-containing protein [Saprospiraceae bacterium]|nr:ATP-binding cassette domain-containing protein [Saprospiraceae bacterium]